MQLVRFVWDRQRVWPKDSPGSLEMEEGDVLDVFEEQLGGR